MWRAAGLPLLVIFAGRCVCFEEQNFECPGTKKVISSTSICDGTVECRPHSVGNLDPRAEIADENTSICVPDPITRSNKLKLHADQVMSNSAELAWIPPFTYPRSGEKLAGYFLTAYSGAHSVKIKLEPTLSRYNVTNLQAWTQYVIILRPFYTSEARKKSPQRIGRAEAVQVLTKEPEVPIFEEDSFECPDTKQTISSTSLCDGIPNCLTHTMRDINPRIEVADEDVTICVPDLLTRVHELKLRSGFVTSSSADLIWHPPEPNSSSGDVLAGYLLTTESRVHFSKTTLQPTMRIFNVTELKPWMEYNIVLRPFYESGARTEPSHRFGRAEMVKVLTMATAPSAPRDLIVTSIQDRSVTVKIIEPVAWNGVPLGYRYGWGPGEEERDIDIGGEHFDGNNAVVAVPGEPGRPIVIYAIARCADESGNELHGPMTTVSTSTIVPTPSGLTVTALSLNRALITWLQPGRTKEYKVSVKPHGAAPEDAGGKSNDSMRKFKISVDNRESRTNSFMLQELSPHQEYVVEVQACGGVGCSKAAAAVFRTAASSPPIPELLGAVALGTDSFRVEYTVKRPGVLAAFDGFQLRYCSERSHCRQILTKQQNVTVEKLKAATVYSVEVRTVFKIGERIVLGPPVSCEVRTHSYVPEKPRLNTDLSAKGPHVIFLEWEFNNSFVQYVEVSLDNGTRWAGCQAHLDCDATFHSVNPHEHHVFLRLFGLLPYTLYRVGVRGCSYRGCGTETWADVRTEVSEPSEPLGLSPTHLDDGGVRLNWSPPMVPAGLPSGYVVTWDCSNGTRDHMMAWLPDTTLTVTGRRLAEGTCSFSVAAYNDLENGNTVVGKSSQVYLP
ncbi:fibronectin-like isoform X4 [Dermacentor silvarum]|uniref:fibronectin-like isoform X4 n=1 Tax=Dermacentor silvarum TaxID=543639 RepID=UPI002101A0DE|nr:fibronectin-like isoform X4 [Dermacentor silvarum]